MKSAVSPYFELIIWSVALLLLAIMPFGENFVSLCPLHAFGFRFCPGCGLGRSIHNVFRGELYASFHMHPLGIPALAILIHRIYTLFKNIKTIKECNQMSTN